MEADSGSVAAAFEVEHSTSIYSGIVRMLDLAERSRAGVSMFLVTPDARREGCPQPVASAGIHAGGRLRFIPPTYSELGAHRDAIGRFGSGLKPLNEISHLLMHGRRT